MNQTNKTECKLVNMGIFFIYLRARNPALTPLPPPFYLIMYVKISRPGCYINFRETVSITYKTSYQNIIFSSDVLIQAYKRTYFSSQFIIYLPITSIILENMKGV